MRRWSKPTTADSALVTSETSENSETGRECRATLLMRRSARDPYAVYDNYNPDEDDYDCRTCCTLQPPQVDLDDLAKKQALHLRSRIFNGGDPDVLEHYCKVIASLGGVVPELPRDSAKNRCWSEASTVASFSEMLSGDESQNSSPRGSDHEVVPPPMPWWFPAWPAGPHTEHMEHFCSPHPTWNYWNQWPAHGYGYGVYTDHNEWPVPFGLEYYAPALNPESPKMRPGDANLQSSWS